METRHSQTGARRQKLKNKTSKRGSKEKKKSHSGTAKRQIDIILHPHRHYSRSHHHRSSGTTGRMDIERRDTDGSLSNLKAVDERR
jgi:hypothetical protein